MKREEAIKCIRDFMGQLTEGCQEALKSAIPELAESEDERIRKGIVETIKQCPDTFLNPKNRDDMLAYLEKQKEQKPDTEELVYRLNGLMQEYIEEGEDEEEHEHRFKCYKLFWDALEDSSYFDEQKPEWSEEDELMMKAIIGILDENDHPKLCSWLKSLKPQPKQEWSEEDENARQNLIAHFEGKVLRLSDEAKKEAVDWLKSLRPSWKPSEEQMKALLNAEGFLRAGLQHDSAKAIAELYEQLKKLM